MWSTSRRMCPSTPHPTALFKPLRQKKILRKRKKCGNANTNIFLRAFVAPLVNISTNVKNLSPAAMATVRTKRRRKTTKQQGNKTTKKAKKASLNQILNSLVSQVILIWLVCDAISPHVVIICVMLNRPTVDLTNDSCYNLRSLCTPATETLNPIGMRWTGICSDFYSEYKGMRAWAF